MRRPLLPASAFALIAAALIAIQPGAWAVAPGYWDTTDNMKVKGREPMLVPFNGRLYSIYQTRTQLTDVGVNLSGRRSDIYFSGYNGTGWTVPFNLTPNTQDITGQGIHGPRATEYRGKLYLTAETVEPSLKDDEQSTDYDIVMRVFDGSVWDPQPALPMHVVSQEHDGNVSDTECRSIVFQDRLYLVWTQVPANPDGSSMQFARMVYRTFDGDGWSPISVIASDGKSIFGNPALAVFQDRLYMVFVSNMTAAANEDILICSCAGGSWTAPVRVNPAVEGLAAIRINMNPTVESYSGRLWVAWQSADPIAKSGTDYDLLASSSPDGNGWTYPVEVNMPNDHGDDITPNMRASNGILYIAWACNDPATTDGGAEADIVVRSYDGAGWGNISMVSPYGDNGTISGEHNPGDDNWPMLCEWRSSLFCTWITYDQVNTGHKGGNPSVIVRQITNRVDDNGTIPEPGNFTVTPANGVDLRLPLIIIGATALGCLIAVAVVPAIILRRKGEGGGAPKRRD